MLADVYSEYSALLPFAPPNLTDRVNTLIAPLTLPKFEDAEITAPQLVNLWKAALSNPTNKDSFAWVFLLLLIRKVLDRAHPLYSSMNAQLRESNSLTGKPLTAVATWFEATRRLAANLYHIGRLGKPTEEKQKVLREAVSIFNFLISADRAVAHPKTARMYFGMRGVAEVLLARTADDQYETYRSACRDLEQSRAMGNRGTEATMYLVEAKLHLFDRDSNAQHLKEAEHLLSEMNWSTCENGFLWFVAGQTWLRRGFEASANGSDSAAATYFASALQSLQKCGTCPPDARIDSAYLAMLRGQAAYKTYTARHELNLPNEEALLEAAIADLRVGGIGGQTLPASLLRRSIERRKKERYKDAAEDLNDALDAVGHIPAEHAAAAARLRFTCAAGLVECNIQLGLELGNAAAISSACEQFLVLPFDLREVDIGAAVYGCRFLIEIDAPKYREIVRKIALNIRSRLTVLAPDPKEYTFAASHAAQLLLKTCRDSVDDHSLRVAYELTTTAVKITANPEAELIGSAAQAALQLAKRMLRKGAVEEATGLFADAGEYFETAAQVARTKGASEGFSLQVAHSKAGEAYMRAHAFSGEQVHADKATENLVRSRELGNTAPELIGMLGDVAYRRGRRASDPLQLREALKFKTEAHLRGNSSRENRSVSAAAAFALWRISGEVSDLATALQTAIEAAEADPTWPWPFFQLAEMASLPLDVRRSSTRQLLTTPLRPDLVRMVKNGESERLIEMGSKLAISSQEFGKSEFGSRQPVYVLDDPHDLLRQTVVFKETDADIATRERRNVTQFAAHLFRIKARPELRLPQPLLLVPKEDKVVYVMRRARGVQLGKTTLTSTQSFEITNNYKNAIEFLAHYHVWRLGGRPLRRFSPEANASLVRKALRLWSFAGFSATVARELQTEFLSALPGHLPGIPKKDAHPENWLVDDDGNLVMLDLEATGDCPLFFEVVQLLDDYPFVTTDDAGWKRRIEYCQSYADRLADGGVAVQSYLSNVAEAYGAFALLRIVFGVTRIRTRRVRVNSSAVRAGKVRDDHYLALLQYIAEFGPITLRPLAARIRDSVHTPSASTAEVTG